MLLAASLVLAIGCDSDPANPHTGAVLTLDVVPATAWLTPGATLPLEAIPRDSTGAVTSEPVSWTSSNGAVTVSATGVAHAVSPGTATILAEAGGVRTATTITVTSAAAPVSWSIEQEGLTDVSLLGAWADASSPFAVVVGQAGVVMESTGGDWQIVATDTEEALTGVWGSSPTNIFAVGTGGVILRRTGAGWSQMASPTTNALLDVWGRSETEVYAVGVNGTILRWDGATWSVMTIDRGWELWGVWGSSPTDVWAVGQDGRIVHFDGTDWNPVASPTALVLFGIWGSSPTDIWAVGINGMILHFDGTGWQATTPVTQRNLFGIWGRSAGDAYAVGNTGVVLKLTGTTWAPVSNVGSGENFRGAWGDNAGRIVVAGWDGTVVRGSDNAWITETSSPALVTVWGPVGGPVWAAGAGGMLFRRGTTGCTAAARRTSTPWATRARSSTTTARNGRRRRVHALCSSDRSGRPVPSCPSSSVIAARSWSRRRPDGDRWRVRPTDSCATCGASRRATSMRWETPVQ